MVAMAENEIRPPPPESPPRSNTASPDPSPLPTLPVEPRRPQGLHDIDKFMLRRREEVEVEMNFYRASQPDAKTLESILSVEPLQPLQADVFQSARGNNPMRYTENPEMHVSYPYHPEDLFRFGTPQINVPSPNPNTDSNLQCTAELSEQYYHGMQYHHPAINSATVYYNPYNSAPLQSQQMCNAQPSLNSKKDQYPSPQTRKSKTRLNPHRHHALHVDHIPELPDQECENLKIIYSEYQMPEEYDNHCSGFQQVQYDLEQYDTSCSELQAPQNYQQISESYEQAPTMSPMSGAPLSFAKYADPVSTFIHYAYVNPDEVLYEYTEPEVQYTIEQQEQLADEDATYNIVQSNNESLEDQANVSMPKPQYLSKPVEEIIENISGRNLRPVLGRCATIKRPKPPKHCPGRSYRSRTRREMRLPHILSRPLDANPRTQEQIEYLSECRPIRGQSFNANKLDEQFSHTQLQNNNNEEVRRLNNDESSSQICLVQQPLQQIELDHTEVPETELEAEIEQYAHLNEFYLETNIIQEGECIIGVDTVNNNESNSMVQYSVGSNELHEINSAAPQIFQSDQYNVAQYPMEDQYSNCVALLDNALGYQAYYIDEPFEICSQNFQPGMDQSQYSYPTNTEVVHYDQIPLVTNQEVPQTNDEEIPFVTNQEVSQINYDQSTFVTNQEVNSTQLNYVQLPFVTNQEVPQVTYEQVHFVTNQEMPQYSYELIPYAANQEVSEYNYVQIPYVRNQAMSQIAYEQIPFIKDQEAAQISYEQLPPITDQGAHLITYEQIPFITDQEAPQISYEQLPVVTDQETPQIIYDQTPFVTNQEVSQVIYEQAPFVTYQEVPHIVYEQAHFGTTQESQIIYGQLSSVPNQDIPQITYEQTPFATYQEVPQFIYEQAPFVTNREAPQINYEQFPSTAQEMPQIIYEQTPFVTYQEESQTSYDYTPFVANQQVPQNSYGFEFQSNDVPYTYETISQSSDFQIEQGYSALLLENRPPNEGYLAQNYGQYYEAPHVQPSPYLFYGQLRHSTTPHPLCSMTISQHFIPVTYGYYQIQHRNPVNEYNSYIQGRRSNFMQEYSGWHYNNEMTFNVLDANAVPFIPGNVEGFDADNAMYGPQTHRSFHRNISGEYAMNPQDVSEQLSDSDLDIESNFATQEYIPFETTIDLHDTHPEESNLPDGLTPQCGSGDASSSSPMSLRSPPSVSSVGAPYDTSPSSVMYQSCSSLADIPQFPQEESINIVISDEFFLDSGDTETCLGYNENFPPPPHDTLTLICSLGLGRHQRRRRASRHVSPLPHPILPIPSPRPPEVRRYPYAQVVPLPWINQPVPGCVRDFAYEYIPRFPYTDRELDGMRARGRGPRFCHTRVRNSALYKFPKDR